MSATRGSGRRPLADFHVFANWHAAERNPIAMGEQKKKKKKKGPADPFSKTNQEIKFLRGFGDFGWFVRELFLA